MLQCHSNSSITKVIAVKDLDTGTDSGAKVVAQVEQLLTATQVFKQFGTGTLAYTPSSSDRNFIIRGAGDSAAKVNNSASNFLKVGSERHRLTLGCIPF